MSDRFNKSTHSRCSMEALLQPVQHDRAENVGGLKIRAVEQVNHVLDSILPDTIECDVASLKPVPADGEVSQQPITSFGT